MKKKIWFVSLIAVVILCVIAGFMFLKPTDVVDEISEPSNCDELFEKTAEEVYGCSEDRDSDGDGLNDYEEHYSYGTNIFSSDSDSDYLLDGRELELGTDPLNDDTDGDGIADGLEVRAGTDPFQKDSDTKLERVIEIENSETTFTIEGNANIYSAVLERFDATGIGNIPGIVSEAVWVYSENNYQGELSICIPNTDDDVSIYRLENYAEYTKIETKVDKHDEKTVLSATVGNGKYIVGVCSFLDDYKETENSIDVFLLIDDSGSMYDEMMDGAGSDPEYKRIDMCRQLLNNAPESIRFGLATFTADYMQKSGLTNERESLLAELDTIVNTPYEDKEGQFNGTYIATSLYNALDNFSENSYRRQVLVILTDGATTEGTNIWSWLFGAENTVNQVIEKANERNVTIITVALGNDVDIDYLTGIESSTNGSYIYANNANAMEDLYAAILNAVNYDFVDEDDDGDADVIMIADSGFRPQTDGLSFRNPIVVGDGYDSFGICYGISSFSSLYYQGKIETDLADVGITDWDLWFVRYLLFFADPVMPYRVAGITADDFTAAGFTVNEDGSLDYSANLGAWTSSEMDKYVEYFNWDFDSEYFDENNHYTENALEILNSTDYMIPVGYGEGDVSYPALDLTVDESTLDGDSLKAHALLRILMRYQITQFEGETRKGYTYTLNDDFDTVKESLASGIPLVLCTSDHAMVACRLRQDIDNPMLFYLDLYDCNHPESGKVMLAEMKYDSDGDKYVEFTYTSTTTDISFYNPHL